MQACTILPFQHVDPVRKKSSHGREKVPGPCRNFGKLANSCFEHWLTKPDVLRLYAEKVLAAPFDPRETSQQLQRLLHFDTARACIRLISLLEKARSK